MTQLVTGYIRGKPVSILVVQRDGVLVEAATALMFDAMAERAAHDGIHLGLTSGFRSNDEQTRLYLERADPTIRAIKGVAAKPGWSNHQSGSALDIRTGMTPADLRAGHLTKVFAWLVEHAGDFGFVRTVPSEPWHWERVPLTEDRG